MPLPETGPREVREAARTFNAMQARIQRLIADRTQALAAVSHDLRSPIQRLRLRAGFLDDTEVQHSIDADQDEMEAMVDGTLAYLRGDSETEEAKPVDLAAILRTVSTMPPTAVARPRSLVLTGHRFGYGRLRSSAPSPMSSTMP